MLGKTANFGGQLIKLESADSVLLQTGCSSLYGLCKTRLEMQRDMPANFPGGSDTRPGAALGKVQQELMDDESRDSPKSARLRANKRKYCSEVSSHESKPSVSRSASTLQYEAHGDTGASSVRNTDAIDNQLALFLGLRGIDPDQVRRAGMELYFSAYGYGTRAERAIILPQLEDELQQCNMLKLVQFFRQFLERDDFDSFAKQLYTWIQDAPAASRAEMSAQTWEHNPHEDSMFYLDEDKLHLLHIFRSLLEAEANTSCTQFEKRLRAELLEQTVMPAEAEQVASCFYDALLPGEVETWNQWLHEEGLEAYWMPV